MPKYSLPQVDTKLQKPLIFGGDALDTERLDDFEFAAANFDAAYVPGYSEQRMDNEIRVRDGKKPIPMPKLQWVRIKRPNAADHVSETDEGMVNWLQKGYRSMGLSDLERYGYGWPPAAGSSVSPDGLICRGGDLALFFVDEIRAARNYTRREAELASEGDRIPESRTGEIYPIEDERFDEDGKLFLGNANTPNL